MARRNGGSAEVREVNKPSVHIRGERGSERTMLAIVEVESKSWSRVRCNYENSAPTPRSPRRRRFVSARHTFYFGPLQLKMCATRCLTCVK